MKKIAIIGSHGLYANYGGWDQLVKNLAERKSDEIEYLIFNSVDTSRDIKLPKGVYVKHLKFKASGFQGLFYDFWSILTCFWKVDTILLLGVQGIPILPILKIFKNVNVVSNVGGIEWERPKFGFFSRLYLKYCFKISFNHSKYVVLDNLHYKKFVPKYYNTNILVIPYGGEIDTSLTINNNILNKYPFINDVYFLSISRSLEDNLIDELCDSFKDSIKKLVLISNLSSSSYGKNILNKYSKFHNIILINGLYNKPELDLIRRNCCAYIHTHTLCGTAPSLVEMIIAQRPIMSILNPQNKYTLSNQAFFFNSFSEIHELLDSTNDLSKYIPSNELCNLYNWNIIVKKYEQLF